MIATHVDEYLSDFVLGELPEPERVAVEKHLEGCARCEGELARTADVLALLALAGAEPTPPSTNIRDRLRASTSSGGRLHRFAPRVSELLDVDEGSARAVLDRLDEPSTWLPLPIPGYDGVTLCPVEAGPRRAGATISFLRMKPGARFPMHKHLGPEWVLTLAGGFRDESDGREYGPGDLQEMAAGTEHSFVASDGPDCICLGVVMNGLSVFGQKF